MIRNKKRSPWKLSITPALVSSCCLLQYHIGCDVACNALWGMAINTRIISFPMPPPRPLSLTSSFECLGGVSFVRWTYLGSQMRYSDAHMHSSLRCPALASPSKPAPPKTPCSRRYQEHRYSNYHGLRENRGGGYLSKGYGHK